MFRIMLNYNTLHVVFLQEEISFEFSEFIILFDLLVIYVSTLEGL